MIRLRDASRIVDGTTASAFDHEPDRYVRVALAHCEAVHETINQIKAIILCPAVITPCLAGMTTVATREYRVIATSVTGVEVTAEERSAKRITRGKLQPKTRSKHQKTLKEMIPRQKRRPSSAPRPPEREDGI